VVMLARAGEGRAAADRIVQRYDARVDRRATILSPPSVDSTVTPA